MTAWCCDRCWVEATSARPRRPEENPGAFPLRHLVDCTFCGRETRFAFLVHPVQP